MIHGLCGDWCLDKNGKCSKNFPKPFHEETNMDEDGYPHYKRRNAATYKRRDGHDAAIVVIQETESNDNQEVGVLEHDEIKTYIETRYVSPPEACGRILSNNLQGKSHSIYRLPIHLPNQQTIVVDNVNDQNSVMSALNRSKELTEYFKLNKPCLSLGLIEDDDEWNNTMHEAGVWMMPRQLRQLFVRILIHCQPLRPEELWEEFKVALSQDYSKTMSENLAQKKAYIQINTLLNAENSSLTYFPSMLQITETEVDIENEIFHEQHQAIATLLPGGKTVHRTFKLLIAIYSDSSLTIKAQSKEAEYLKSIDVFFWDEAPMAPRHALQLVDRNFRDIMNSDKPFGVGNGTANHNENDLKIPENCIAPPNTNIAEDIYKEVIVNKQFDKLTTMAILSARNIDVDDINKSVIELLDISTEKLYTSINTVKNCDNNEIGEAFLPEYLETLNPPNLPPHELRLRVNTVLC
ncbi:uncharacterized protein LOC122508759 [Leptopilina heterotoma]|uniref:uncharacterized protein LOC122508759 n=1 Tax=Leptopilina heterotoma TaxID=63436 RepID=UPI001CA9EB0B|nr:uncharacterized protein LOC122508759 [Leptopilina heterotoma]